MVDLLSIINNITGYLPSLEILFMLICWLMGAIFVMLSIQQATKRSEMGRNAGSWGNPLTTFAIGVCFVAMPGVLATVTQTLFGVATPSADSIFAYAPETVGLLDGNAPGKTMVTGLVMIIQFYGAISIARGLYLLNQSSTGGGPKTFGPGLTHVIAGGMATNFPLFVGMIEAAITG